MQHFFHGVRLEALDSWVRYLEMQCVTWLIRMRHDLFTWDMTHSHEAWLIRMWHDSFKYNFHMTESEIWKYTYMHVHRYTDIHICHITYDWKPFTPQTDIRRCNMWHDSFIWDMTHPHEAWLIRMRHNSFKCDFNTTESDVWRFNMWYGSFAWDMTHSYETWLIRMRHDSFKWDFHVTYHEIWRYNVWHDSFIWDVTHSYETWLIHMRHDSFAWDMSHSNAISNRLSPKSEGTMCAMTHEY